MRAGWAEGSQAEPDEGPTFQCWAETGSQPLKRLLPLFPTSWYCRVRTIPTLLPPTARLSMSFGPRPVVEQLLLLSLLLAYQ